MVKIFFVLKKFKSSQINEIKIRSTSTNSRRQQKLLINEATSTELNQLKTKFLVMKSLYLEIYDCMSII